MSRCHDRSLQGISLQALETVTLQNDSQIEKKKTWFLCYILSFQ